MAIGNIIKPGKINNIEVNNYPNIGNAKTNLLTAKKAVCFNYNTNTWKLGGSTYGPGFTKIHGGSIWTDGENTYYSGGQGSQYVYDINTNTWKLKIWNGLDQPFDYCIWSPANLYDRIYYSNGTNHYILNKSTSTWTTVNFTGLTNFRGDDIWTDGTNTYYSSGTSHYKLSSNTSTTWQSTSFSGLTSFYGWNVFTGPGGHQDAVYCFDENNWCFWSLNKSIGNYNQVWTRLTGTSWNTLANLDDFSASYICHIGSQLFYIYWEPEYDIRDVYELVNGNWTNSSNSAIQLANALISQLPDGYYLYGSDVWTANNIYYCNNGSTSKKIVTTGTWTLQDTSFNGPYGGSFYGSDIWTDGDNIYYSSGTTQYVLDKSTSTWTTKTWNGLTSFYGSQIWTDGTNIYHSDGTTHYVLNKSNSTWSTKTWNGLNEFNGKYIWTDGTNIYLSDGDQYVLNKSTSTWSTKTWSGLSYPDGTEIWTDGTNIYHSDGTTHYVLNKSNSTWTTKTWSGLTNFYGEYIWTDGTNIYYSYGTTRYVLNKSISTWTTKTWSGLTNFYGNNVWSDGTNIHCSYSGNVYFLPIQSYHKP